MKLTNGYIVIISLLFSFVSFWICPEISAQNNLDWPSYEKEITDKTGNVILRLKLEYLGPSISEPTSDTMKKIIQYYKNEGETKFNFYRRTFENCSDMAIEFKSVYSYSVFGDGTKQNSETASVSEIYKNILINENKIPFTKIWENTTLQPSEKRISIDLINSIPERVGHYVIEIEYNKEVISFEMKKKAFIDR